VYKFDDKSNTATNTNINSIHNNYSAQIQLEDIDIIKCGTFECFEISNNNNLDFNIKFKHNYESNSANVSEKTNLSNLCSNSHIIENAFDYH